MSFSARAELDGNLPPIHDPSSLIQVKNINKGNVSSSGGSSYFNFRSAFLSPCQLLHSFRSLSKPRRTCLSLALLSCLSFAIVFLLVFPCRQRAPLQQNGCGYCPTSIDGPVSAASISFSNQNQKISQNWIRVFNEFGK